MTNITAIKLFEDRKVRSVWNAEIEKWYILIVDVVGVLTDSPNPRKYWSVLKTRQKKRRRRVGYILWSTENAVLGRQVL